jgi:hypothetical protein
MHVFFLVLALQQWVLVTDIHLDPFTRSPFVAGRDTSPMLWKETLREMHQVAGNAPEVIVGGDFLAHHFPNLARDAGMDPRNAGIMTMRGIANDLARNFPRARFAVTLGNDDDPCGDYRSDENGPYMEALARIFAPLVDRDGAAPTFLRDFARGGYYVANLPIPGERLVALNAVYWSFVYTGGCYSAVRDPGRTELRWLDSQLGTGRNLVLMHMPIGYDPLSTAEIHRVVAVPFLRATYNRALLALFAGDRAHISFAVAGHTHRYDFRTPGGVPMLIGSSVSSIYNNNPAFYVLDVDASGTLTDVIPYVYDPFEGAWERKIGFDEMYGIRSFTGAELAAASKKIESDPSVRDRWISAYDVWSYGTNDLGRYSWRVFWCAQTHLGSDFAQCAPTQRRTEIALAAALAAAAVIVVGAALTFVWLRRWRRAATGR